MDRLKSLSWKERRSHLCTCPERAPPAIQHLQFRMEIITEFIGLVERIDLGDDRFLVHLDQPSQYQLLAYHNGTFVEGPTFEKLESHTQLANGKLILNLKLEEVMHCMRLMAKVLKKLIEGKQISRLENSPDNQTYTYVINKDGNLFTVLGICFIPVPQFGSPLERNTHTLRSTTWEKKSLSTTRTWTV